jgi:hypothetical protein
MVLSVVSEIGVLQRSFGFEAKFLVKVDSQFIVSDDMQIDPV